jgi:hypothetical protein
LPFAAGGLLANANSLFTIDASLIFARLVASLAKPPRAVADAVSPTLLNNTLSFDSLSGVIKYESFDKSLPAKASLAPCSTPSASPMPKVAATTATVRSAPH